MLEEIMKEILSAEEQAEEIIQRASEEAKEIAREAETKRAGITLSGKKAAADLLAALEKETDLAATEEENRIVEKGTAQAKELKAEAEKRVGSAADAIAKQLFEAYGVTTL